MARLVKKFGGTSVADLSRIDHVAARIKQAVDRGDQVAAVVSAMAGQTNHLVELCRQAADLHDAREYDTVVSSGEQVTAGLLAIVMQRMGITARSWLGWQIPCKTDGAHGAARIEDIAAAPLLERMAEGHVPIVAGFQGVGPDGRITTLGRGGSDTSAVALAAALKADRCDIYTDVEGVFTTDPRIVSKARKLDRISYEEMLELASQGAKVLQTRSVMMAVAHGVRVQVLSSFSDGAGTLVVPEGEIMEQEVIRGLAYSLNEAKVTVVSVEDTPGVVAKIFTPLSRAGVNVDMIVQNEAPEGSRTNVTFTVPQDQLPEALAALSADQARIGYQDILSDTQVVKISAVGLGMKSHSGVAETMFTTLADRGINIQVISTSEIKLSVLIASDYLELALRALHKAYGLDAKEEPYG
ncbi:MAG: aspartate kinase [Rhodothalassiaceae bacterium]